MNLDFLKIATRSPKQGWLEIYPKFIVKKSKDLMIRGGDFYAVWCEERGLWSTDEVECMTMIDRELDKYAEENQSQFAGFNVKILWMWDSDSGSIDRFHKYCQKQMRDNFHQLDEKIIFANDPINKEDYASKRLPYPLEDGNTPAYDKLIGTLYSEEERHKIEWAIGAIVSGDSRHLQKFIVLYGSAGTGKSTILNIIQQLFEGYYSVFDAKALGSSSNAFALEPFKSSPLVAIQHDGDLSHIEDNTRLNSLVSHETMTVNEKFKAQYANKFKAFLFMGTNKPVRITDAKSGLMRRLIDVTPSGDKLSIREYNKAVKQVKFELGAIAKHCLAVYLEDPDYYQDYIPINMLGASNDFYNFMIDSYHVFKREDGTTLKQAWEMYKTYVDDAKIAFPSSQRVFKEELKNYFKDFQDRFNLDDGTRVRSYYIGFKTEVFEAQDRYSLETDTIEDPIIFKDQKSIFDEVCSDCLAQYATDSGTPMVKWEKVKTVLAQINTSKLHYVKVPENHIVIDFDIPGPDGEKSYEKNLEAASRFPATYAELSKSGAGIHLHYIYSGDVEKLERVYAKHIEIKVFTGNASLRRMLSKCNDLPIATISSGLPLKKGEKVVSQETIKSEKSLRSMVARNLEKEFHPGTKPSIDFITKILDDAYNSGLKYDISDMRPAIDMFAAKSTHQSDYCLKAVGQMKFKSDDDIDTINKDEAPIIFLDTEVFPNLFLVNWKYAGEDKVITRMINPRPKDIEELFKYRIIGFNNRKYDNHMLYACYMGYTNEQLFNLSQKIVNGNKNCLFGAAYNLSYTDVYDFASASNKKSLKKLEIEMGIHHQELGLPWDQPVPEELWEKVAKYCDNDVIATEAAFNYLKGDWTARQILADLAGMTVNDTTNSLTTRIIFGNERRPQSKFNYRNLAEPVTNLDPETKKYLKSRFPVMMKAPHGEANSLLPYFHGYVYENGKSTYRGVEVGEGGYVYSEPGIYGNVALLDVASMHPHSALAECLFGPEFTRRFDDIVYGRVNIKHEAWSVVDKMLDGKLTPYIQKVIDGEMTSKELANLPDGVDVLFNTNKPKGTDKRDVLKKIKDDPDNPFGSLIKERGGQSYYDDPNGKFTDPVTGKKQSLSLINKRAEEGDWLDWKDKLSAQFLAKQSKTLITKQLNLSMADADLEYNEIKSLTNPVIKKKLLMDFANSCDSDAVHLKAAALPRQKYQVLIPLTNMKDNEVYAPNYNNGEKVALIRYPHGGTFEIPILTVNNKNKEGKSVLGTTPKDAIGITKAVADRLSGADFDGDAVMVIPISNKVKITSTEPLQGLKDFDPKLSYPERPGMRIMKNTQIEMGKVSNLITDMTIKGATSDEIAKAVRHSMVVIDAEKHRLDYKQSEKDNDIAALKKKYQGSIDERGRYHEGAATLISRAKSETQVVKRKGSPTINEDGTLSWKTVDNPTYVNKQGKTVVRTQTSTKMMEARDARELISEYNSVQERLYADYANHMKQLANEARREILATDGIHYKPSAKKTYKTEVDSLDAKLDLALRNAPRERKAQTIANTAVNAKKRDNPDLKPNEIKKISQQELTKARAVVGAKRENIVISDKEWEAIQAGAISSNKLTQIVNHTDVDRLRELATPREKATLSQAKINKISQMSNSGYTIAEIAKSVGCSASTVSKYLS